MSGTTDLDQTLASLDATPQGTYVFATVSSVPEGLEPFAVVEEDEGTTVIVREQQARDLGLPLDQVFARITLGVQSPLDSIGLTATIAQTLASRSIPCNVVAGYFHDHLFVPADRASEAWSLLDNLARQAKGWLPEG
ncbi:ACT domain-containing protein [Actinomyces polynesiensis]|uniref:ACT domain-containing protein n=1 Tax=Actinomyces polynesiensis TaxID=1325934 RepID=UPI0005BDAF33|nr:ACT domain-containing protein [Actinomyces polynesiensis]